MNPKHTINIRGEIMDLSTPKIMGIVNLTPDSFYDKSRFSDDKDLFKSVEKMLADGADFIDIGGYSSRPGAIDISEKEEIERVIGPIKRIVREFPEVRISIDTFRSTVAQAAVEVGSVMVNDISGGHLDSDMLGTVARLNVPYIAMHLKGTPQTMRKEANYQDLILEITHYFSDVVERCNSHGIKDLILDPGFGFAKTIDQNFQLLNNLEYLQNLSKPLLVGLSRKSMIYKSLNVLPEDALNGTTALNSLALFKGAAILRVHDIREAVEVVKLVTRLS